MDLEEIYKTKIYEPLEPTESNQKQFVYKFNSVTHFISYVESLDKNFRRGTFMDSSDKEEEGFSKSRSLKHAYQVIRETSFSTDDTAKMQAFIREIKKQTRYDEEGDELVVPEYLANSDKQWIRSNPVKKPAKIIEDMLFIDVVCSCARDAGKMNRIALNILMGIYKRNVIPRKIVIALVSKRAVDSTDVVTFIDVNFSDLNGIAKCMHPSAFRRLHFRLEEIFSRLNGGYGSPSREATTKGYINLDHVYEKESMLEQEIDTFLGVVKK